MYNIILTVSSIKMQTEYWCKLFYFVLSAVGKRIMRPAFRQASVLIHVHYKIVGYLDPPMTDPMCKTRLVAKAIANTPQSESFDI